MTATGPTDMNTVTDAARVPTGGRIVFGLLVLGVAGCAGVLALDFHHLARYFPLTIASTGVVLGIASTVMDIRALRKARRRTAESSSMVQAEAQPSEGGATARGIVSGLRYALWMLVFPVAIWVLGIHAAVVVFLAPFLRIEGKWSLTRILVACLGSVAILELMTELLAMQWPTPLVPPLL